MVPSGDLQKKEKIPFDYQQVQSSDDPRSPAAGRKGVQLLLDPEEGHQPELEISDF